MKLDRRLVLGWSPALLFMASIWVLSSMTLVVPLVALFPLRDKGVHFCVYATLSVLVIRAARITWPRRSALRVAAFGAFVTILWGLSDELHQAFVPGRSSELLDLLADALGATAGAILISAFWAARRSSSSPVSEEQP
ncbi:MAG: antibiotic resistance protein VanZ [Deltaproteobacteria bacterium]|nr:antibiotic resistance protein VanZ [Deltaproteobacteria bacterium]